MVFRVKSSPSPREEWYVEAAEGDDVALIAVFGQRNSAEVLANMLNSMSESLARLEGLMD